MLIGCPHFGHIGARSETEVRHSGHVTIAIGSHPFVSGGGDPLPVADFNERSGVVVRGRNAFRSLQTCVAARHEKKAMTGQKARTVAGLLRDS
jgi:hypothetical protein